MPGMGRSLQSGNSVIVSAFHTALLHQLFVVLILGALCAIGFNVVRTIQYRRLKGQGQSTFPSMRASRDRNRPPGASSGSASAPSGSSTGSSSSSRRCRSDCRPAS